MSYKIEVNNDSGYIHVLHYGESDVEEFIRVGQDALSFVTEHRIFRVLADVSGITNKASITDLFTSTTHHAETAQVRPKTAIFGKPEQREELYFLETVGVNRGMNLKIFTDSDDALKWLLKEDNPE